MNIRCSGWPQVKLVINFDLPVAPDDFDSYTHRIGRTGRAYTLIPQPKTLHPKP
jgi:superfamily II DNA/RNA helicase